MIKGIQGMEYKYRKPGIFCMDIMHKKQVLNLLTMTKTIRCAEK